MDACFNSKVTAKSMESFGVPERMYDGFASAYKKSETGHPLEQSEANYFQETEKRDLRLARNTFGLGLPVKIKMEREFVLKNPLRLPTVGGSNLQHDILTGRIDDLPFDDVLRQDPEFGGSIHALVEKRAGIVKK